MKQDKSFESLEISIRHNEAINSKYQYLIVMDVLGKFFCN